MNNDTFQRNCAALSARWPQLWQRLQCEPGDALDAQLVEGLGSTLCIDGIQLSSRHDRIAEARTQAQSLPPGQPVLHLYGTGLGDLQRVLLQSPGLATLNVHILNGAVFLLVLQLLEQHDWLEDPRVHLAYADDREEIALPYFALPAELVLADETSGRIRDRLVSENHVAFNNLQFDAQEPDLLARVSSNLPLLRNDPDVAELFGSQRGRTALVVATGPSLERHYGHLRQAVADANRPLLICVDTALRPLLDQGLEPDIVVTIDKLINDHHLPVGRVSASTQLVYVPMVDPALLHRWPGPRFAAYAASAIYAQARQQVPKANLHVAGSVIHPAVDLAVKMGAVEVVLFGADFAFPHGKTHSGWGDGALGPSATLARHWVLDGHGQRVATQLSFRSYLIELERYIAAHPEVCFLNTSRDGAMITGTTFHPEFCP